MLESGDTIWFVYTISHNYSASAGHNSKLCSFPIFTFTYTSLAATFAPFQVAPSTFATIAASRNSVLVVWAPSLSFLSFVLPKV